MCLAAVFDQQGRLTETVHWVTSYKTEVIGWKFSDQPQKHGLYCATGVQNIPHAILFSIKRMGIGHSSMQKPTYNHLNQPRQRSKNVHFLITLPGEFSRYKGQGTCHHDGGSRCCTLGVGVDSDRLLHLLAGFAGLKADCPVMSRPATRTLMSYVPSYV